MNFPASYCFTICLLAPQSCPHSSFGGHISLPGLPQPRTTLQVASATDLHFLTVRKARSLRSRHWQAWFLCGAVWEGVFCLYPPFFIFHSEASHMPGQSFDPELHPQLPCAFRSFSLCDLRRLDFLSLQRTPVTLAKSPPK